MSIFTTKVKKYGNSLGIIIPPVLREKFDIKEGDIRDFEIVEKKEMIKNEGETSD